MSNQGLDARAIEQRMLELAYTTDTKITATALAYFAPCSIEAASRVLDDLAAHDRLKLEIDDAGTVFYDVPGREKLGPPRQLQPRSAAPLVRAYSHYDASPLLAGALSVIVPGAGHLYAGRAVAAVLWFLVVSAGYVLIVPGLILHLFNIASATVAARRHRDRRDLVSWTSTMSVPTV